MFFFLTPSKPNFLNGFFMRPLQQPFKKGADLISACGALAWKTKLNSNRIKLAMAEAVAFFIEPITPG
jgi:hypothetical protein